MSREDVWGKQSYEERRHCLHHLRSYWWFLYPRSSSKLKVCSPYVIFYKNENIPNIERPVKTFSLQLSHSFLFCVVFLWYIIYWRNVISTLNSVAFLQNVQEFSIVFCDHLFLFLRWTIQHETLSCGPTNVLKHNLTFFGWSFI